MTDAKSGVLQKKCPTKKGHAKKNRSTRDKTKTNLSDQAKVRMKGCFFQLSHNMLQKTIKSV